MALINGLTWKGHKFLDNIRPEKHWKLAKQRASKIGKLSISALASGANYLAQLYMANPTAYTQLIENIKNQIG